MIDDQEIVQIHKCRDCGMSQRKAAEHTGLHRRTVRKYWGKDPVAKEFRKTSRPNRQSSLEEHREYLEQQFVEHRENCDVVRQVFARDKGVKVPLRTLQDFLKPCRIGWLPSAWKKFEQAVGSRPSQGTSFRSTSARRGS